MNVRSPDAVLIAGASTPSLLESTIRELVSASSEVAFAVEHVRLSALHRVADVLQSVNRCRIVLGRLDVHRLEIEGSQGDARRIGLLSLLDLARGGRLQIRTAGALRWDPDFSLYHFTDRRYGSVCLLGAHYLARPHTGIDWPLTCLLTGPRTVQRAVRHYEAVWTGAHDALAAVTETLERQLCTSTM